MTRRRDGEGRTAGCLAVLIALVVVVGAGGFAFLQGRDWLQQTFAPPADYEGNGHGSILVEVAPGDSNSQIAKTLHKKDVIESVEAFTDEARTEPKAQLIQAGFYQMRLQMSARSALDLLIDPDNLVQDVVTVPEGLTVGEIVQRVAKDTDIPRRKLQQAAKHPDRLGLPPYAKGNLEGFLFPATYAVPPKASARQVLSQMVDRFQQAATKLRLKDGAKQLQLTPLEVVTVASIVEREARRDQDRPKVARVIYNRLAKGMPLKMDSTVHYAVQKKGTVATTEQDRKVKSPYNTYRYKGLPPGPIAAPGEASLRAALHPADGKWLYFVTVNVATGETRFAVTGKQHAKNVERYRAFCRKSDLC